LLQADLFPRSEIGYRLVVSNPPYVPEARLEELPAEYAWEPAKALTAGTDGLACVERILARAPRYLAPDGLLILEVGEAQDAFTAAHPGLSVTWLEFERGGEGVFMLTRRDLTGYLEG
jgi:ribosomal protein L3 glutamine methyltransferase